MERIGGYRIIGGLAGVVDAKIGVWGIRHVGRVLLGCRLSIGKLLPFELPFVLLAGNGFCLRGFGRRLIDVLKYGILG